MYPKELLEIAAMCERKWTDDLSRAKEEAAKRIRRLPIYDEVLSMLFRSAVDELVEDARHRRNNALRKEGEYKGKPKVVVGKSKAVLNAEKDKLLFAIAGREWGSILGEEMEGLAAKEFATGNGYYFRGRLLLGSRKYTPDGRTAREVMTKRQVLKVWREAECSGTKC